MPFPGSTKQVPVTSTALGPTEIKAPDKRPKQRAKAKKQLLVLTQMQHLLPCHARKLPFCLSGPLICRLVKYSEALSDTCYHLTARAALAELLL